MLRVDLGETRDETVLTQRIFESREFRTWLDGEQDLHLSLTASMRLSSASESSATSFSEELRVSISPVCDSDWRAGLRTDSQSSNRSCSPSGPRTNQESTSWHRYAGPTCVWRRRTGAVNRTSSERKQAEGKSRREALRCLKRQLARTV